ncbi:SGNH/GDSL hydrolase family protein [Actinoplanes sp. CA-252034]|uniref:SGNH/GDSL hydrolase family protein n=1 Tax=Actinoplanes sp. CA-252034 TaxID=3239906 RepID=UPI003D9976A5
MILRRVAVATLLLLGACTAPEPAPGPREPVVVTLGDSVPAGTGCECVPFPDRYAGLLSPGAASVNLAEPGFTAADVREQVGTTDVRDEIRSATLVVVMAGANDMAEAFDAGEDYPETARAVRSTVSSIVDTVHGEHDGPVDVLVLGYWNVVRDGAVGLDTYGAEGLEEAKRATRYCNDALREAAERSGATYLDTSAAFASDPTGFLGPDGDHPNAAGHEAIAALLYDHR